MAGNEKIADKIRKLLNKAEGTQNEHEADAFFAKAQALMVQHAIDEAELIRKEGKKREEIVTKAIKIRPNLPRTDALRGFLNALADCFNCKCWYTRLTDYEGNYVRDNRSDNNFIAGFESDVEFVEMLFYSVQMQQHRALLSAREQAKVDYALRGMKFRPNIWNRNFIEGYLGRVATRMSKRYREVIAQPTNEAALALQDRKVLVDEWADDNLELKDDKKRKQKAYEPYAHAAGREAGNSADISGGRNTLEDNRRMLGD